MVNIKGTVHMNAKLRAVYQSKEQKTQMSNSKPAGKSLRKGNKEVVIQQK